MIATEVNPGVSSAVNRGLVRKNGSYRAIVAASRYRQRSTMSRSTQVIRLSSRQLVRVAGVTLWSETMKLSEKMLFADSSALKWRGRPTVLYLTL